MNDAIPRPTVDITQHPQRRGVYQLRAQQFLPVEREQVFAFFSDAFQLEAITPPWLRFQVVTPAPIELRSGTVIDYKLRIHGIPLRWRSLISVWEPPLRFVDEQLRGPYRLWHHEHRFEPAPGGTMIHDTVDYSVPGGALVHRLLVGRDVRTIFEYRTRALEKLTADGKLDAKRQPGGRVTPSV
jgi:ligand-binding SRPBCC domain-containing protein